MKIEGLPSDVLRKALNQAMDARHHILDVMEDTISQPAEKLSGNAPRLETVELPKDKIGEVIGPKGKNIRKIEEELGFYTVEGNGVKLEAVFLLGSN